MLKLLGLRSWNKRAVIYLWSTLDPSSWNTLGDLEISRERREFGHGFGREWERKSEEFGQNFKEMHPIYTKV